MIDPLALVPKWALAIALAFALALAGVQTVRLASEEADHAKSKADFAQAARVQAENLALTQANYRKQEAIWRDRAERIGHDTRKKLEAAIADRDAGRDAADGLQRRVADLAACGSGAAQPAGAASGSAPAEAPGGLLAYLFRRLDEAADRIAEFADRAHIAGTACVESYESLK